MPPYSLHVDRPPVYSLDGCPQPRFQKRPDRESGLFYYAAFSAVSCELCEWHGLPLGHPCQCFLKPIRLFPAVEAVLEFIEIPLKVLYRKLMVGADDCALEK